ESVTHAQLRDRVHELAREGFVHRSLDQQAIGAHAGLAAVAVLAGDGAGDRGVEVRVLENDERRIAAELHGELLHRTGALRHELLADGGRAGEGDLADRRVGGELAADGRGIDAGDHIEHAGRDPGTRGERRRGERRVRRLARRLHDYAAAGGERRSRLARDHRQWKIPRRDGGDDADRLSQYEQASVGLMRGYDVAIEAFALLGEPFDEGGAVSDLTLGFRERLALFGRHERREIFLVRHQQLVPAAQD